MFKKDAPQKQEQKTQRSLYFGSSHVSNKCERLHGDKCSAGSFIYSASAVGGYTSLRQLQTPCHRPLLATVVATNQKVELGCIYMSFLSPMFIKKLDLCLGYVSWELSVCAPAARPAQAKIANFTQYAGRAMAVVGKPAGRQWMVPGVRTLVKHAGEKVEEERILCWPWSPQGWVTSAPNGQFLMEDMRDFAKYRRITGAGVYPVAEEVEAFAAPFADATMGEILRDGRFLAHKSTEPGYKYHGAVAMNWSGAPLEVPRLGVLQMLNHRLRPRTAPVA